MPVKRMFIPGDEWLYYKIYSGPKFLEDLLINQIYELTFFLKANGQIDKFYFVRYSDHDGYHLRIRYHFLDDRPTQDSIKVIAEKMMPFIESKVIWKIAIDSYKREIERYGEDIIDTVETIFDISSLKVLNDLRESVEQQNVEERWLKGIVFVENILDTLEFTHENKRDLYNKFYDAYSKEFKAQKVTREYLKEKFREHNKKIEIKLSESSTYPEENYLDKLRSSVLFIADKFKESNAHIPFESLLYSIFHMHFNRIFLTKSRSNEFVLYYLMGAYYNSVIGKERFASTKPKK
jgi:thiopeptide-type bacteriocin biosynthesis protein